MGPANSVVVNQTSYPLCLVTFNNTDILYPSYHSFFVVPPGQRLQVDANPDAFGLKIGFIHSTYSDGGKAEFLCYHRLQAKNESVIYVTGLGLDGVKYSIDSPNKGMF